MARGAERGSAEERIVPRRGEQSPPPGPGQMLPPARASGPHAPGPEWPRGVGAGGPSCVVPAAPTSSRPALGPGAPTSEGPRGPRLRPHQAPPSWHPRTSLGRGTAAVHTGRSPGATVPQSRMPLGQRAWARRAFWPRPCPRVLCPVRGRRPPPGRLVSRRADGAAQSVRKRECGGGQTGSRTWRGRSRVGRGGPATPVCCSLPLGHHSSLVTPLGAGSPRALPRGPCLALLSPPFSKRGGTLARASWPGRPLPPEVQAQGPSNDAGDTRSPRAPALWPGPGPSPGSSHSRLPAGP